MKAVVVLSGGQDSATALALAVKRYGAGEVAAVTFRYGQRHALETRYARQLARRFGITAHKVVSLPFYRTLTSNALFSADAKIERRAGASCPTTVVEGRNACFLLLASVWAKSLGAKEVWTGVSEADSSGYPDCRAAFIRSQEKTIRLALEWPVEIVTPFMRMTKAEEWALADRLGILEIVKDHTLTCYRGIPGDGCGTCPACRLRARGYRIYMKTKRAAARGKGKKK